MISSFSELKETRKLDRRAARHGKQKTTDARSKRLREAYGLVVLYIILACLIFMDYSGLIIINGCCVALKIIVDYIRARGRLCDARACPVEFEP
jgi:hypothetical protein